MTPSRNLNRNLASDLEREANGMMEQTPSKKAELMFVKGADVKQKMRKLFLMFTFIAIVFGSNAQIKVANNSNVGIGTNNPTRKLEVFGTFRINSNWTDAIFDWSGTGGGTTLYPSDTWGLHFGKPNQRIGHIYAYDIYSVYHPMSTSDEKIKENIRQLDNPIEKIKRISAYNYNFKKELFPEYLPLEMEAEYARKQIGFLAQELEKEFPELVRTPASDSDFYYVDYIGMVPVLVEAIKEQQNQIDNLQKMLSECCSSMNSPTQKSNSSIIDDDEETKSETQKSEIQRGKLFNNIPNPFNGSTEIRFEIPDNATSSRLMICNLNGVELKSYNLTQKGLGSVTIQGSEFAAGIYLYTLIIDNQIVDTKKMVLTN